MDIKALLIVTGLILALFLGLGCLSSSDDDLMLSVDCASPYSLSMSWSVNGQTYSDEITQAGHYSKDVKGQNVSITAYAQKIDPSNLHDELEIQIIGRNEAKKATTFYPNDEIGGTMTGVEDRNFLEGDDK